MGASDEPTFQYEIETKQSRAQKVRPACHEAWITTCDYVCIHRNDPSFRHAGEGDWIVSHMPTGVALWHDAQTWEEAQMFATAIQKRLGDEFLLEMQPRENEDHMDHVRWGIQRAKRDIGRL